MISKCTSGRTGDAEHPYLTSKLHKVWFGESCSLSRCRAIFIIFFFIICFLLIFHSGCRKVPWRSLQLYRCFIIFDGNAMEDVFHFFFFFSLFKCRRISVVMWAYTCNCRSELSETRRESRVDLVMTSKHKSDICILGSIACSDGF